MQKPVSVGLIGSRFISTIHAESLRHCAHAQMVAVASLDKELPEFAAKYGIPKTFNDYRQLLALPEVDMVVVGVPNALHCQVVLDAAARSTS